MPTTNAPDIDTIRRKLDRGSTLTVAEGRWLLAEYDRILTDDAALEGYARYGENQPKGEMMDTKERRAVVDDLGSNEFGVYDELTDEWLHADGVWATGRERRHAADNPPGWQWRFTRFAAEAALAAWQANQSPAPPPAMPDHVAVERQLNATIGGLERALEQVKRERDAWIETARQNCRDVEYYRGLVTTIGEGFGVAALTSDDGSVQQDVLCAKVPELVNWLWNERDTARRELAECQAAHAAEVAGLKAEIIAERDKRSNAEMRMHDFRRERDAAVERLREVLVEFDSGIAMRKSITAARDFLATLPATESGGGVCSESPAAAASKDSAPAGDSAKRPVDEMADCIDKLNDEIDDLRARLDAAGAVVDGLETSLAWAMETLANLTHLCPDGTTWQTARYYGHELKGFAEQRDKTMAALAAAREWQGGGE